MQLPQIQPADGMHLFHWGRRRRWRGFNRSRLHLFSGRFAIGMEMPPDFVREVVIKCTGVRLLVLNADLRQIVDNHIAFHFQFTCQFIDPNLPHA
jgi:hypothetical protein